MGVPYRKAARVIVIDEQRKRTLLIRGHDQNNPTHTWWFTVGGGLHEGETHRQGARRECYEETGIKAPVQALVGPVVERRAAMFFADRMRCQDEKFYLLYTTQTQLDNQRWTADEKQLLDEMRWFNAEELGALSRQSIPIYPPELKELLPRLLERGWDGQCVKIDEYRQAGASPVEGSTKG